MGSSYVLLLWTDYPPSVLHTEFLYPLCLPHNYKNVCTTASHKLTLSGPLKNLYAIPFSDVTCLDFLFLQSNSSSYFRFLVGNHAKHIWLNLQDMMPSMARPESFFSLFGLTFQSNSRTELLGEGNEGRICSFQMNKGSV